MRSRTHLLALLLAVVASAACDAKDSNTSPEAPAAEATSATTEPAKAKAKAPTENTEASAAPLDCKSYVKEVIQACSDAYRKGLDINCLQQVKFVETARKQANGNLFEVGDDEANAEVAQSLCQGRIEKLRAAYAEQDGKLADRDWGPSCSAFLDWLESDCLAKLGKADLPQTCTSMITMTQSLEPGDPGVEERCGVYESL